MIGLDTNIIVRYLRLDDPTQAPAAVKLVDSPSADNAGFLSIAVLAELAMGLGRLLQVQ
jgi:predicted nucleic-acid-binding protein